MTVFVDDMYLYPMGLFGRMKMSHMIGTDEAELHAMAQSCGVRRKWYQGDHYDVSMSMRRKAIRRGAVAITWRQCGAMSFLQKMCPSFMEPPDGAIDRYLCVRSVL